MAALSALALPPRCAAEVPFRSPYPEEPERYDSEYYLDLLTMRFDREWRDYWYARDNVFMLRFGSLNVEQWNLEQALKLSVPVSGRFRIRYWLEMRHSLEERAGERSELELEARLSGPVYLSLLVAPSFWKRENDAGVTLQVRRAVDRFARLTLRVRDFAHDFAYEHGENIEGQDNRYETQPLELAFEARGEAGRSLRFGSRMFLTNTWAREYRLRDGPAVARFRETACERDLSAWIEYEFTPSIVAGFDLRDAEYANTRSYPAASPGDWVTSIDERHAVGESTTLLWYYPYAESHPRDAAGGGGLVERGGTGISAGFVVRHEKWRERRLGLGFAKHELLPFLLFQRAFRERHVVECGYLADSYRSERGGIEDERRENRLKLAYEIRFKDRGRFRLIETIDLDREDWGQFSVHDHFFVMLALGF